MKPRQLILFLASAVAGTFLNFVALTQYWLRKQPVFSDAPALRNALAAFAHDRGTRGRPLPNMVSLRELVDNGFLTARQVHAFDGVEVTILLKPDEDDPQEILMEAHFSDGSRTVLLTDGSVQGLRK